MKKYLTFVIAAFACAVAFAAVTPGTATETTQRGDLTFVRTLASDGTLAETVCQDSSQGSVASKRCVTQTAKLSKRDAQLTYAEMRSHQMSLMAAAPVSESPHSVSSSRSLAKSVSYSMSGAQSAMATRASVIPSTLDLKTSQ